MTMPETEMSWSELIKMKHAAVEAYKLRPSIYRTLLAFAIKPSGDYRVICEVGAFVYSRTPTLPAKVLLKGEVEKAYDLLSEDRGWRFPPEGVVRRPEDSARVDADEKPADVPYGKVQHYVFWYDKRGRIVAAGDARSRSAAATSTKYDEAYFRKLKRQRR